MTGPGDRPNAPLRFGLAAGASPVDLPALAAGLERALSPRPERRQAGTVTAGGVRFFFKWERSSRWRISRVGRASLARRACQTWERLAASPAPPRIPAHMGWWERRRLGAAASWGVITQWVEGARTVSGACAAGWDPGPLRAEVENQIGRLHRAGFAACSIDANNVLVRGAPESPEVWVVDLEHAVPRWRRGAKADLAAAAALFGGRLRPGAAVPAKPAFPPPRLEPVPGAGFPVEVYVRDLPPAAAPE